MTGLTSPTSMVVAPDGRLFVADQQGTISVVKNGNLLSKPFAKLTQLNAEGERGLLGIELDPNFSSNGYVYVYYTSTEGSLHNRVARFTADGDVAEAGSFTTLVDLPALSQDAVFHMGGAIHFGVDNKLYVALGDHQYFDGTKLQTLEVPFSKILRFNPDGSIPSDNPWYNEASGINRAAWAMGLRNPFTFAIQPGTGKMLINDVGQETWEEINLGKAGANYGWPSSEGPKDVGPFTAPVHYYNHDGGRVGIAGAEFYNPQTQQFPDEYIGRFFFADLGDGIVRTLDSKNNVRTFGSGFSVIVDFDVAPDGSLYYLQRGFDIGQGSIGKITYGAPQNADFTIVTHPQSKSVAIGQSATFSVTATGSGLSYQWRHNGDNIEGANGSSYTVTDAQQDDAGTYSVIVSSGGNSLTSNDATLSISDQSAPSAKIIAPKTGVLVRGGQTITFDGRASDVEDGKLGGGAMTWQVDYITGSVVRPLMAATSGIRSGTFTVPADTPYKMTDVVFRVTLTVEDSDGATTTVTRELKPRVSRITVKANIPGVTVSIDEQPKGETATLAGVVGLTRVLGVPREVEVDGKNYVFSRWSDGGDADHDISFPAGRTTYIARYKLAPSVVNEEIVLTPTSDAYVFGGDQEANFGSNPSLFTKNHNSVSGQRETFLKFDLNGIGSPIQSAELRLWGRLNQADAQNIVTGLYAGTGRWGQSSVKWSNAPGVRPKALQTAVVNDNVAQWYVFDIGEFLEKQRLAGKTSVTLVLKNITKSSASTAWNSAEADDNKPQLTIKI